MFRNVILFLVVVLASNVSTAIAQPEGPFEPDGFTVVLLHCDEGEGDIASDATDNGFDMRLNDNADWIEDGMFDAALDLTADGSAVRSEWRMGTGWDELTLEAWINVDHFIEDNVMPIVSRYEWYTRAAFYFGIYMNGALWGGVYTTGDQRDYPSVTSDEGLIEPGEWYHVALTWSSGDELILWLDGDEVASVDCPGGVIRNSPDRLTVGYHWNNNRYPDDYFFGYIDEVRISDVVRDVQADGEPAIFVEPDAIEAEGSSEHALNIANEGDRRLRWRAEVEVDWITCEPDRGFVEPGADEDMFVVIDAEGLGPGAYETDLRILSNDPENRVVVINILLRIGDVPAIEVTWLEEYGYPDVVDWNLAYEDLFNDHEPYEMTVEVSNHGISDLIIEDIFSEHDFFTPDPEEMALEPGESEDVTITFINPQDEPGDFNAILIFVSNDPDEENFEVALHARDFLPPIIEQNMAIEENLRTGEIIEYVGAFANAGEATLRFTVEHEIIAAPMQADWISYDPEEGEIEGERDIDFIVTLNAAHLIEGDYLADIHIFSNDPADPDVVINALMHIIGAPVIAVSPEELNFGEVLIDESEEMTLTISNEGVEDLTVSDISVEGDYFSVDFEDEFVLEPDENVEITVSFTPEELGDQEDVLLIISDDPDDEEIEIPLRGVGVDELPPVPGEPLIYWDFNEGERRVAHDGSGNGFDGTIVSATWHDEGHNDNCLYFDGRDDYVTLDDNDRLTIDEGFMATAWIYPQFEDEIWHDIMRHHMQTGEQEGWVLQMGGNRVLIGMIKINDRCFSGNVGVLPRNIWTWVALAWDGETAEIWVNGELGASWETEGEGINSRSDFCVGRLSRNFDRNNHFEGRIDEAAFYAYYDRDVLSAHVPVRPDIAVEPERLDFGEVSIERSEELMLTISNTGNDNLTIGDITIEGDGFSLEEEELVEFNWEFVQTDNNMALLVQQATLNGEPLQVGDYVGVFTPDGLCAGFSEIVEVGAMFQVSAWGAERGRDDGFQRGEPIEYRFWESDPGREYVAEIQLIAGQDTYFPNEIMVVNLSAGNGFMPAEDVLDPGGELEVQVFFSPDAAQQYAGVITILSDDPDEEEIVIPLTGVGVRDGIPNLRHFTDFIETDVNHSLLILEFLFHEEPVSTGWEIGVFAPDNILSGAGVWEDGERLGIAVWGDDVHTEDVIEGFRDEEHFVFCVWDDDADIEYPAYGEFEAGQEHWTVNGNSALSLLSPGREITVPLREGWNMISINIIPLAEFWENGEIGNWQNGEEGPNILLMTEQLRIDEENHRIDIMKNDVGQFYAPAFDFNNIPYWNLIDGYLMKMNEAVDAVWLGEPIPANTDVPLGEGWNMAAYFPPYELDASAPDFYVLSPIIEQVIVAKDGHGCFMWPQFDFSNMEPWHETQGYMIKVNEDVVLNYPPEQDEVAVFAVKQQPVPCHWTAPAPTDENMSVLVTSVKGVRVTESDQIAAFSLDGSMIAAGMIDTHGRCGLAVWGDDPSTEVVNGLLVDETFELRLWNADHEVELSAGTFLQGEGLVYEPNEFIALDVATNVVIPEVFYLTQNYPNPFNAITKISYGLPEASRVSIRLYDISGRLVATLVDGDIQAGCHSVTWEAGSVATGVYLVRMETQEFKVVRKLILIK